MIGTFGRRLWIVKTHRRHERPHDRAASWRAYRQRQSSPWLSSAEQGSALAIAEVAPFTLKPVYTAALEQAALDCFAEFATAWETQYPAIFRLWTNAWADIQPLEQGGFSEALGYGTRATLGSVPKTDSTRPDKSRAAPSRNYGMPSDADVERWRASLAASECVPACTAPTGAARNGCRLMRHRAWSSQARRYCHV